MQSLSTGIQTFERLRRENRLYVDKTETIYHLITTGAVYFISRPRRFGKSLLVSTLAAIFQGQKELFQGLWIAEQTDYSFEPYTVLQFDFSKAKFDHPEQLETYIKHRVDHFSTQFQIKLSYPTYAGRLAELIEKIGQQQKIVILIDEYDKPLLDNLDNSTLEAMRDTLKGFYGVIKASDAYLRFVLLTGITRFARVSIFSDLNNLLDISLDSRYAELLGITQDELEHYFADRIDHLAEQQQLSQMAMLEKIKIWYNGYRFSMKESYLYNPFSTLMLFEQQQFNFHWFVTGTPTFLIKLIQQSRVSFHHLYEDVKLSERRFSIYRLDKLEPLPLLFQTGYLTIKAVHGTDFDRRYSLNYPNFEVKQAFLFSVLDSYSDLETGGEDYLFEMVNCFQAGDLAGVFEYLKVFFANVPYDLQLKHEKYYQTIFYAIFQLIGLRIQAEVKTNSGRIDAVVETTSRIYIFEFKLFGTTEEALAQIRTQRYYDKYRHSGREIWLVGVAFDQPQGQIADWRAEPV